MSKLEPLFINIVGALGVVLLLGFMVSPWIAYHLDVGMVFYEAITTYPMVVVIGVLIAWLHNKISWEVCRLIALAYTAMIFATVEIFANMTPIRGLDEAAGILAVSFILAVLCCCAWFVEDLKNSSTVKPMVSPEGK